ncbi:MAG TPA: MFS transporter [Coleofasciculaceae cyanobacterium]|jgi:MFS family permease
MNISNLEIQQSKTQTRVYKDRNLRVILSVTMVAILPIFSINPTLGTIAQALGVSSQQITLIVTAFLVPVAVGTPIFGFLGDRFGKKQILIPSLLLFALGGVLCATAQDFRSLIEWRCLQGFGAASLEAMVISALSDLYKGKRVTTAMALNASAIGVGSTIYPALGGGLADINWRLPFLLSLLAIPVAVLVLLKLKLPTQAVKLENIDFKTYVQNISDSIKHREVMGLLFLVVGLFAVQFGAFYTFTPVLAGTVMNASASAIGIVFSANSISLALVALLVGLFATKLSEVKLIKISLVIFAVSLLLIFNTTQLSLLLIPSMLIGAVEGMAYPSIQALLAKFAPEGYRAGFMSMNVSIQAFGRALGPILAAIALQLGGMPAIYYGGAAITLVILVVFHFLLIPRRTLNNR